MTHSPDPSLRSIRACLEGAVPGMTATCAADGTPNVAYLSQVFYVDEGHVALSFQFFNKTRQNILANPCANVLVTDPVTARYYRLHLRYLRTETTGALFERMKAQLAGIASHEGMAEVFALKGSDIYAVERVEALPGEGLPPAPPRADLLGALRLCSQRLARCNGLDELLQALQAGQVDAAAFSQATWEGWSAAARVDARQWRVLMSTEPRADRSLSVRGDFGEGHRNAIAAAFLALEAVPGGKDILRSHGTRRFVLAPPEAFDPVRDAARQAGLIR